MDVGLHRLDGVLHREATLSALAMSATVVKTLVVVIRVCRRVSTEHLSLACGEALSLDRADERVLTPEELLAQERLSSEHHF